MLRRTLKAQRWNLRRHVVSRPAPSDVLLGLQYNICLLERYVELLYHPILQVVILRKSNHGFSTVMHWRDDNDVHSVFSARAFSGLVFQTLNWKMNYRYQCRGICRGQGNAKFLIFELDESRILTGKNQYEQENCSMNLKCRLYRSKWVQSITVSDVMESGQVVENPMIGAIPSRNEVQRELDDLLMSM